MHQVPIKEEIHIQCSKLSGAAILHFPSELALLIEFLQLLFPRGSVCAASSVPANVAFALWSGVEAVVLSGDNVCCVLEYLETTS